jgi:hypothetical protein
MSPRAYPEYFIQLSDDDWEENVLGIKQRLEDADELVRGFETIRFDIEDSNKPRKWDEIVFHDNKFYKFQAALQDANNNRPTVPQQRVPGKLESYNQYLEWVPCGQAGNSLIVKDTDYPGTDFTYNGFYILMYTKGGPIVQLKEKYYVYNNSSKEIFGGNADEFFAVDWWSGQSWGSLGFKQGPEDTMTVEVFADGKPVNKHDLETGAITGQNIDVSSLPPGQAAAVADAVDEGEDEMNCPTGENNGDDGDDGDDTHHDQVQAERDLEKAMIEWVAKGSNPADDPRLLQGQNPPPPVGTASGYNIEELDGSKYHKKSKVRKSRKKKI